MQIKWVLAKEALNYLILTLTINIDDIIKINKLWHGL